MNEKEEKVFEFILEGKNVKEIKDLLKIDNNKLVSILNNLRNNGISIMKKYYIDGNIGLSLNKGKIFDTSNYIRLMGSNIKRLKMLVISDLHFGSLHDKVDLLDKAYQYAKDNNINIILNLGDLIDGRSIQYGLSKNKNMYDQFRYLLNNYPYDKDIVNFIVLGNHDVFPFSRGFNLIEFLCGNRLDLVPVGIETATIDIGNSSVGMYHPVSFESNYNYYNVRNSSENDVNLFGHSHLYEKEFKKNKLFIKIPTLSNLLLKDSYSNDKIKYSQGMIELFLIFQNEYINTAQIKYLKVDPYIRVCDEKRYNFKKTKK